MTLSVGAEDAGPFTSQWFKDGVAIAGANSADFALPSVQLSHAGTYSVTTSNPFGGAASDPATLVVGQPEPSGARLLNLSTRAVSFTGDNVLIPGFVINDTTGKKLLIRVVGPNLGGFGVNGVLDDPMLTLKRTIGNTTFDIATNDNWGSNPNVADILTTNASVGAFELDAGSGDAALLTTLEPGQYSVVAQGADGGTGVAIVELYDADAGSVNARLVNISTRGFAGTGDQVMIPGFIVSAEGPRTLLVRAVGPAVGRFWNFGGVMSDPKLIVNRTEPNGGNTPILTQDNWGDISTAVQTAQVAEQIGAFPLAAGGRDAAFVITLPPGVYTVVGSSADGVGTGIVLVEVYIVD